ncbi:phosphonate degradation HD-domain oxygenase [Burkholderia sp. WSM2232]|uniref:phosphonate degradation HD-domain oxygenase n=1 Tax=Burkholderia sp. WSM2232 TaxID=944436 RepID=UPI0003FE6907|nr:phosphonate degradation HD-domain oxygenase [Burkholderia sp. WSM2232]
MALTVSDIRFLFEQYGDIAYSGEPVTQLQHALQTGALAEEAGADDELVVAAFLHDLGHLLNQQGETPTERGVDDLHQYFALPFLRAVLPDAVLEPIRLHVDAKRCLCAIDDTYIRQLSADSLRSLALQGGVFSLDEADAFLQQAYAQDAQRLRKWDDEAKEPDRATPDLGHYLGVVERVMSKGSIARFRAT